MAHKSKQHLVHSHESMGFDMVKVLTGAMLSHHKNYVAFVHLAKRMN